MANTVLVIEKEPAQRDYLCGVLKEKLAYDTISIPTGRDAIDYVVKPEMRKPDLILFDVSTIPQPAETIANLRVLTSHSPIVVMVRFGDYNTAMLSLAAGAQDFLSKPASTERIGTTFRNVLMLRDARRETESLRLIRMTEASGNGKEHPLHSLTALSLIRTDGSVRSLLEIEADAIRFAMQYYNGRMTEIARRLGIGRSTLYRKLSEMNIRHTKAA
jgi:DNA-binding NtrC family response regulator